MPSDCSELADFARLTPPRAAAAARRGATSFATRAARVARLVYHLLRLWLATFRAAPSLSAEEREAFVRRWAVRILQALAVRVVVRGEVPAAGVPVLLVANHVSWLDSYALNTVNAARFVAKSEVAGWPVVGRVAAAFGTFFIKRGCYRDAARTKDRVAGALCCGQSVAAFPEGTTSEGDIVRRFFPALLQAAVDAGTAVQPVAIRYRNRSGATTAPAYVGDMSIADSLGRLVRECELHAELVFCPPLLPIGGTRRELATQARQSIAAALGVDIGGPAADAAPSRRRKAA